MDDPIDFRLIVVAVVLLFGAVGAALNWRKRAAAKNWPMVVGRVEQTCVNEVNHNYFPALLYS